MTDRTPVTAADIEATRDGDWVTIRLCGKVVKRRFTRDRSLSVAELRFVSYDDKPTAEGFSKADVVTEQNAKKPSRGSHVLQAPVVDTQSNN